MELSDEIVQFLRTQGIVREVFLTTRFRDDVGSNVFLYETLDRLKEERKIIKLYSAGATPENASSRDTYYVLPEKIAKHNIAFEIFG